VAIITKLERMVKMNGNKNTVISLIFLSTLIVSIFTVSADDSIINQTNYSNNSLSKDLGNSTELDAPIQPMSWGVTLTVNPTSYNLGTIAADGLERAFTGATTARVQAYGLFSSGDLYVRTSGNFVNVANASQTIPYSNFQFECPGYATKRAITTTNFSIHRYYMIWSIDNTYTMNYYFRVPPYTDPGVYSTTIIYTAT